MSGHYYGPLRDERLAATQSKQETDKPIKEPSRPDQVRVPAVTWTEDQRREAQEAAANRMIHRHHEQRQTQKDVAVQTSSTGAPKPGHEHQGSAAREETGSPNRGGSRSEGRADRYAVLRVQQADIGEITDAKAAAKAAAREKILTAAQGFEEKEQARQASQSRDRGGNSR